MPIEQTPVLGPDPGTGNLAVKIQALSFLHGLTFWWSGWAVSSKKL
jgi:hypothetical protein